MSNAEEQKRTNTKKKIILVDFDGVLHSYTSGWKGAEITPDLPVPGAIEWLRRMLRDGRFRVCIYSSRSRQAGGVDAMREWLLRHGVAEAFLTELEFPTEKLAAFITIDDRAMCFEGTFPDPDVLDEFVPWNKRKPKE